MIGAHDHPGAVPTCDARRGFTLIELLISIGIIAILTSIILAVVNKVRESSLEPVCENNLRQLMIGFRSFAQDHDDQLPGGFWDSRFQSDPDHNHWDWLRGDWTQWSSGPAGGTLFRYVSRSAPLYRCPALSLDNPPRPSDLTGPGIGSNGRYDYVSMLDLTGARLAAVKSTSQLTYPDGRVVTLPTPVLLEGDPTILNGFGFRSWHAGTDAMSHTHHGGAFYASTDSSVQWLNEPPGGCTAWQSQAPSGKWVSFSPFPFLWGQWNRQ